MHTLQAGAGAFRAIFLISTIIAALSGQAAPAAVAVQVSPKAQGIVINTNQQFTATVTGNTDTRVTWTVNGVPGGKCNLWNHHEHRLLWRPRSDPFRTMS